MAARRDTWLFSLRLIVNAVPWLVAFQSAWGIVKQVWLPGSIDGPELVKLLSFTVFFAIIGVLVTWRLPPHDAEAGLGPNIVWTLRVVVTFGLWIEVIDQIWMMASTIWTRNPIEKAVVVYTIVTALITVWFNLRWMPRDLGAASR